MRRYDVSADKEAHAHAVIFGGVERIENALEAVGRNAGAAIDDRYGEHFFFPSRADAQHSIMRVDSGHGVGGVDDQIDQNLLELHANPQNLRQPLAWIGFDDDALLVEVEPHQAQHFRHKLVDVEG